MPSSVSRCLEPLIKHSHSFLIYYLKDFYQICLHGNETKKPFTSSFSPQALDSLDWNAANCVYRLFYRTANASWINITISNCTTSFETLTLLTPNTLYEIAIRTENSEGPGPTSPSVSAQSGQRPPTEPPVELDVLRVDSSSFEVGWDPLPVFPPRTVDGYWVWYKITSFSLWSNETCQYKDMHWTIQNSTFWSHQTRNERAN